MNKRCPRPDLEKVQVPVQCQVLDQVQVLHYVQVQDLFQELVQDEIQDLVLDQGSGCRQVGQGRREKRVQTNSLSKPLFDATNTERIRKTFETRFAAMTNCNEIEIMSKTHAVTPSGSVP